MSETELNHTHIHSHSETDVPVSKQFQKILLLIVIFVLAVTTLGIFLTFPSSKTIDKVVDKSREVIDFSDRQVPARVDSKVKRDCDGQEGIEQSDRIECSYVLFDLVKGEVKPSEGQPCVKNQPFSKDETKPLRYCVEQSFDAKGTLVPKLEIGSRVVLSYRSGDDIDPSFRYQYADQDRRWVLVIAVALFLLAVVLFGAWRGLLAVCGLIVSLIIISFYILPALVGGENGIVVALAGGSAVAASALYLAHGFKNSTHIAFLSSIGAVLTIAFLAQTFFTLGRFSGFVSEEASFLAASGAGIDLRGLLIAGVILASLGALDDMTVTQVSVVSELHNARPDFKFSQIWKSAVRIGRDHVASTVNTLALAYVGTSLAVMVLFVISQQQFQWIANSESIAVEILGALTGSIGLIVAVPLSTAIAAIAVHKSGEHDQDHNHEHSHEVEETKP